MYTVIYSKFKIENLELKDNFLVEIYKFLCMFINLGFIRKYDYNNIMKVLQAIQKSPTS